MSFNGILSASLSRPLQQDKLPSSVSTPADIYELERHRDHCRHAKDYREAQRLEDRLNALKDSYEKNGLKELEAQQADELASSDAVYQQALQQLLQEWDGRIAELQDRLQEAEQQLVARQLKEATALLAAQAAVQPRPKFSPALLNMRHIERTLAFQKEFTKADKVKQQADQLELLELSQLGADMAGKQEAERAHLAARHSKERDAASKKAASAVLAAQQRQACEVEQLTRKHQAAKLSLSRGHAAQRLSLQQGLRGSLGLARPTKLLGLPSFNSSLTETRGLVPASVLTKSFDAQLPPPPRSAERCRSPLGASGLYGVGAAGSPPASPPAAALRRSLGGAACSCSCSCAGRLRSPGGHPTACCCSALADAAAAAAGYGLAMPPLTAGSRSGAAASKQGVSSSSASKAGRPCTRAGSRVTQSGSFVGACSRGSLRRSSSADGSLPCAAGAVPARSSAGAATHAKPGSLRGSWGTSSQAKSSTGSGDGSVSKRGTGSNSRVKAGAPLRATNSHSKAGSAAPEDSSNIGSRSNGSSAPRSRLQSLQGAAAEPSSSSSSVQDTPAQRLLMSAAASEPCTSSASKQQFEQEECQPSSIDMAPASSSAAVVIAGQAGKTSFAEPGINTGGYPPCQSEDCSSQAVQGGLPSTAHAEKAATDAVQAAGEAAPAEAGQAENSGGAAEVAANSGIFSEAKGEHSNADYGSDFEEEAAEEQTAEEQAEAADAGDLLTAATEPEPDVARETAAQQGAAEFDGNK